MNSHAQSFLFPQDQILSRQFLTLWPRRLPGPLHSETPQRYLFFWARNAIFWSLKALNIPPGASILAPAYICRAAVEPLTAYGVDVDYYNVARNCEVDLSDLEAKIHERTRAVMVVHYFGFPQPMIYELRKLCDSRGLLLIEDCAHVLQGEVNSQSLGTFGDASVFSWRKHLPVYDGGELVLKGMSSTLDVKWSEESILLTLKIAKNLLESAFHPTGQVGAGTSAGSWLHSIKQALQRSGTMRHQVLPPVDNGASFNKSTISWPMSRLSRQVMAHSDLDHIVSCRRANYFYLLDALCLIGGINIPFLELSKSICPLFFPLLVEGMPDAHLPLRRLGIPAVTWNGVRPPAVTQVEFPDADFLYQNLILLPVHQCLEKRHLETIIRSVRVIRNGKGL